MIGAMHTFFAWVSLVTLALGGIGVMNIMLVAVQGADARDRRPQGGRRHVARRSSGSSSARGCSLTLLSGAIGFLIGLGLCALVNLAPMPRAVLGDGHDVADDDDCRSWC